MGEGTREREGVGRGKTIEERGGGRLAHVYVRQHVFTVYGDNTGKR